MPAERRCGDEEVATFEWRFHRVRGILDVMESRPGRSAASQFTFASMFMIGAPTLVTVLTLLTVLAVDPARAAGTWFDLVKRQLERFE